MCSSTVSFPLITAALFKPHKFLLKDGTLLLNRHRAKEYSFLSFKGF